MRELIRHILKENRIQQELKQVIKNSNIFDAALKGIEKGDFTMVFGFPGRTQEYLTSFAVENIMNISNPTPFKVNSI